MSTEGRAHWRQRWCHHCDHYWAVWCPIFDQASLRAGQDVCLHAARRNSGLPVLINTGPVFMGPKTVLRPAPRAHQVSVQRLSSEQIVGAIWQRTCSSPRCPGCFVSFIKHCNKRCITCFHYFILGLITIASLQFLLNINGQCFIYYYYYYYYYYYHYYHNYYSVTSPAEP